MGGCRSVYINFFVRICHILHRTSVLFTQRVVIKIVKRIMKSTQEWKMSKRRIPKRKNKRLEIKDIDKVYYDMSHSASFGGKARLRKIFPRKAVDEWAKTQMTYSLHKPLKRKFITRSYRVGGMNELWQIDLLEMIPYHSINLGYKYILVCIDVFTRFVRVKPLKTKTSTEVVNKLDEIFQESEHVPRKIQSDFGKEFYNKQMKSLFAKYGIHHYTVDSQFKASIVERFNRTLREKLNRYFTYTGKKQWHKILDQIVVTYNNTKHSGIYNMSPGSITPDNEFELWLRKEEEEEKHQKRISRQRKKIFSIGDYVRISRISITNPFYKNFDQNWSEEAFKIIGVDERIKPIMYLLEDLDGEIIKGKFYGEELQYIGKTPPEIYRIENIIRERGKGENKEYFVKWYGYTDKYNSWISASQLST